MPLSTGTRIGPYEIVGWLGAGGMGEVYRARDGRLGREVALKLIPERFATDRHRLHRFEQEARAAGQLNHPNILAVHDIGTHDGGPYIVSELLEGETLRQKLITSSLPSRKAIDYARQTAEGLAAAHDRGIVHRDLKPDNLFITSDGRVKILDFGIAKLTRSSDEGTRETGLPTETEPGTVVGTASYMSPEQVRGATVDARSDLFSLGSVLYEMLAGRPAFKRETAAETMAAILKEHPPQLGTDVSPALERIVSRCLEQVREARFQSARDLAFGLEVLSGATGTRTGAVVANRPRWRRDLLPWAVAAIALLTSAWLWTTRRGAIPDLSSQILADVLPPGVSLATEEAPMISPDGRQLTYVGYEASGKRLLYRRAVGEFAPAQPVPNTEGASLPFWSPESQKIGFFAQGWLKTVDINTGNLLPLTAAGSPRGGTWSGDVIVFVPHPLEGPQRIRATGGEKPVPVAPDADKGWFPSFLPDGRHFLVFVPAPTPEKTHVALASLDSPTRTLLVTSRSNAIYVEPGYLLFWRDAMLFAQPFDARTLQKTGNEEQVTAVGLNPVTNQLLLSASRTGTLAFFAGAVGQSELAWFDRAGGQIGPPAVKERTITTVSLAHDGASVVYDEADHLTASFDIMRLVFKETSPSKRTTHPGHDVFPALSFDGTRIAYMSVRDGAPQLWVAEANHLGNEQVLLKTGPPKVPTSWAKNDLLIYNVTHPNNFGDIWVRPQSGEPRPVVDSSADERYGTLSPDGRWLAYISNEDKGNYQVWVRDIADATTRRQVTATGGFQPQWSADGKELFYLAPDKTLMVMEFKSAAARASDGDPPFTVTPPTALFRTRTKWLEIQPTARNYAVAPDAKRFLIVSATEAAQSASITVAVNWTAALRK